MKFITIIIIFTFFACTEEKIDTNGNSNNIPVSKAMGETIDTSFSKAIKPKTFEFPKDHGPHKNFRTEWWYFTGNLISTNGEKFGYQFTIFRNAINTDSLSGNSTWRSNQFYMGHFAVTDITNNKFYFDERFSRDGNNLAGASIEDKFRVWLEDWEVIQINDSSNYDLPDLKLSANMKNVKFELFIRAEKQKILQGNNGLSQKGSGIGNASYYYSYTRLETKGNLAIGNNEYLVSGSSWMDREWSTSALSNDQVGWDWFSIQLNNNTELMYYQMRKSDGRPDIFSNGVIIDSIGNKDSFNLDEIKLTVNDYWVSNNGSKYPSGWKIDIPSRKISLVINPSIKNQLMDVSVKYWEGSVNVSGIRDGINILGSGYVELTGY
jgi:predicted secreted hydrolase